MEASWDVFSVVQMGETHPKLPARREGRRRCSRPAIATRSWSGA